MQWFAQAPSNIALIKYMGKLDAEKNIPMNASLSYTLSNLVSSVMLEQHSGKKDYWEPLNTPGSLAFTLSEKAQERYLRHLARIKTLVNYQGAFIVRSCNNFPHSSGLASSASSFAALTKCAILALSEIHHQELPSIEFQAQLSRIGSGSSCRSFFSPWALWQGETVKAIELPYPQLLHQVIVISREEKAVASMAAHQMVQTSPHFVGRAKRAEQNLKILLQAFEARDWQSAKHVCWQEFQDLHQLFSSSKTPFSYFTEQSQAVLDTLQQEWQKNNDGPIITMDAGPNIHLLYRPDQAEMARQFKQDVLIGNYDVL